MTNPTPTQVSSYTAQSTPAQLVHAWTRFCLRLLLSIPIALAKGVIEIAHAIGKAAEMTYVDPFMPNRKRRD